ncbi:MAG TPA: sugar phosphate isomerase/epimerase [Anaerolineae bacterium]|nr:sugar phosphate isomerase/epimerase [Anaerolineae bacterium]HIQ06620.1 sugar phosphate isomerase/epimerase [Anaerolineae bacterium]
MRIGVVSLGFREWSLPQTLELAAGVGAECLELNTRPGVHQNLSFAPNNLNQIQTWVAGAGMMITSLGGYNDFAQVEREALEAQIEKLVDTCRLAADLGVPIVRAFAGDPKPGYTLADFWSGMVYAFQQVVHQIEPLGVTAAIENHGRLLNDGESLGRLVEEVGSAHVRLTLDTGNFCWAGHNTNVAQAYFDQLLPYVVSVHVKDGVWCGDTFHFVPAGQGELDLAQLMQALAVRGYNGPICSEFEGEGDFLRGTQASVAYLRSLREQMR